MASDQYKIAFDTIVIPAHDEGFRNVFLAEHRWLPVLPIQREIMQGLRYIAVYRTDPVSAITHFARIKAIKPLANSKKLEISFEAPQKIGPLRYLGVGIGNLFRDAATPSSRG